MTTRTVVVGVGGFGREVLDVLDACNWASAEPQFEVVGVIDDAPAEANLMRLAKRGVDYLGRVEEWSGQADPDVHYLIGVGSPAARRSIDHLLVDAGLEAATAVHPTAVMGHDVALAPGAVVCAGVVMTNNIRVGRHSHLNLCTTVGHDARIGDFVTVNPSVNISGGCTIEDAVMLGVGSAVLQGLTVHEGATVGGGACVVRDVPTGVVVKGIPAK